LQPNINATGRLSIDNPGFRISIKNCISARQISGISLHVLQAASNENAGNANKAFHRSASRLYGTVDTWTLKRFSGNNVQRR
jgi:hypothetical protein